MTYTNNDEMTSIRVPKKLANLLALGKIKLLRELKGEKLNVYNYEVIEKALNLYVEDMKNEFKK
jgi:hypothetical protein